MAARPGLLRAAVRISSRRRQQQQSCISNTSIGSTVCINNSNPRYAAARTFCTTTPTRKPASPSYSSSSPSSSSTASDESDAARRRTTHFGFEDGLSESEKTERVAGVFHSVAESYDRMNDLMSFGWHRVWKDHFVSSLNPGLSSATPPAPQRILDVAGGTGDIAFRLLHHAHVVNRNPSVHVTISDINPSMLAVGKQRSLTLPASQQAALSFLEADATSLPPSAVAPGSVDLYTVAFGIRNFANIPAALAEARRVLKPGGVFTCLEFSKVVAAAPLLDALYKRWSFGAIPLIGQLVAGDRDSYQYLVESIERFPSQEKFRGLIEDAGFVVGGKGYENLTGGVAAIHKGMKPL
ncbi:ubiE/COQ5 methyltransferase family-domain-containing protein [Biscogniauxia marginata]|nr:ubiE/COQ5 methyltransferase family-domain-containing protein [Biscogniauxia marginata]